MSTFLISTAQVMVYDVRDADTVEEAMTACIGETLDHGTYLRTTDRHDGVITVYEVAEQDEDRAHELYDEDDDDVAYEIADRAQCVTRFIKQRGD